MSTDASAIVSKSEPTSQFMLPCTSRAFALSMSSGKGSIPVIIRSGAMNSHVSSHVPHPKSTILLAEKSLTREA